MKNTYLIILFILITSCNGQTTRKSYANYEESSKLELTNQTSQTIENLELLGYVWGFLKYHHQNVAEGDFNWDFELFEILSNYTTATTTSQRDKILLEWINSLGNVDNNEPSQTNTESIKLKPNFNWIHDYQMSDQLKEKIEYIYDNRNQGKQHYIKMTSYIGNPVFINEADYKNIVYPDDGFSILALYRYWNAINYFYPYKHLTDKDWDSVLKEYIPIFLNIKNELEYELAILKLISEINDSHANIIKGGDKISDWYGNYHSSIIVGFIENKLVITDFYNPNLNESDLKIGDEILEINDEPIYDIVEKLKPYVSASNKPTMFRKIASNILRSKSPNLTLKLMTSNGVKNTTLALYEHSEIQHEQWVKKVTSRKHSVLNENIGYIPVVSVNDGEIKSIMKSFKDTKGIIIDLRNYPNTTDLLYKLVPYFMSSRKEFAMFSKGNINHPGEFVLSEPLKFSKNKNYYKSKLIVLVNEYSQSLAEYMAMAYQTGHNTTIVGSTTAGADGDVSYLDLPGGIKTIITGIGVYYPNGKETQRIGIKPNIIVNPTIDGIRNKKDEILDKAIELVLK